MKLPLFSAEASLSRPSKSYQLNAARTGTDGPAVIPQRIKLTTVRCACDSQTDICVCDNGRVLHLTLGDI
jgi:hypothetical protein